MPYASDAQRRYFNVPENKRKLQSQGVDVDEWNEASKGKDLPERAKKKEKKASGPDRLPGGLADGKPDSAYPEDQLDKGEEVEMEHVNNDELAEEIAKDHLQEDKKYYDKLEVMESGGCDKSAAKVAAPTALCEFLPDDVQTERMLAAISGIKEAADAVTMATSIFPREGIAGTPSESAPTEVGTGSLEKSARPSINMPPGVTQMQSQQAPTIAPSDDAQAMAMAGQQLAGFEKHEAPMAMSGSWQGAPGDAQMAGANLQGVSGLGFPIATGKLGNGAMMGGLNGQVEKYAELADFNCGDLTVKDRGDLGVDFHQRTANDKKLMFLTQGGELGMLDWLKQKYPEGRETDNVLAGHKKAAESCSADQNWLERLTN
jgi:hypothetical protein